MTDFGFVRVLVCPDKFAGTLSAAEAADAIAAGWRDAVPGDQVVTRPLSDGGPGFLAVLARALDATRLTVPAWDPLGRPVQAEVLLAGSTAYVESAQTCGLHLLAPAGRDPLRATSFGLGAPIAAAVESGVREIVVGLGGSATNDAGAGLLAALGAAPLDRAGYVLPHGGAALAVCVSLSGLPRLRGVGLVAATDVDNPLTGPQGASAVFGPQKGAGAADVTRLDAALAVFAEVLQRDLLTCPPGLAERPGAGAAGGLGAAILACGGRREPGFGLVRQLTGLDAALAECDLVLTGEGSLDEQSLRGKVVAGIAAAARELGRPCAVLAGRVELTATMAHAAGITGTHSLVEAYGPARALADPAGALHELAGWLARRRAYHGWCPTEPRNRELPP